MTLRHFDYKFRLRLLNAAFMTATMIAKALHDEALRLHEESLRLHMKLLRLQRQSLERLEETFKLQEEGTDIQEENAENTASELVELSKLIEQRSADLMSLASFVSHV